MEDEDYIEINLSPDEAIKRGCERWAEEEDSEEEETKLTYEEILKIPIELIVSAEITHHPDNPYSKYGYIINAHAGPHVSSGCMSGASGGADTYEKCREEIINWAKNDADWLTSFYSEEKHCSIKTGRKVNIKLTIDGKPVELETQSLSKWF